MHKRETTQKQWSLLFGDHYLPLRNVTILYEPLPELLKYQTWLRFFSLTDLYRFFQNNILKIVAGVQGIGAWPLLVQI